MSRFKPGDVVKFKNVKNYYIDDKFIVIRIICADTDTLSLLNTVTGDVGWYRALWFELV